MARTVEQFLGTVSRRLNDPLRRQWKEDALTEALNGAFAALCARVPDAHVVDRELTLVSGTRQKIDADLHRVLEVTHNVASGRAVTKIDRGALDRSHPTWRADPSSGSIKHWMQDDIATERFEVWPPASAGASLHTVCTQVPRVGESALDTADELPIDAVHYATLEELTLYFALVRDGETTGNTNRAQRHWNNAHQLMNDGDAGEAEADAATMEDDS